MYIYFINMRAVFFYSGQKKFRIVKYSLMYYNMCSHLIIYFFLYDWPNSLAATSVYLKGNGDRVRNL